MKIAIWSHWCITLYFGVLILDKIHSAMMESKLLWKYHKKLALKTSCLESLVIAAPTLETKCMKRKKGKKKGILGLGWGWSWWWLRWPEIYWVLTGYHVLVWFILFSIYPYCYLEEEVATHSSVLAWRIPGMREPGGLPSTGSHRVCTATVIYLYYY